MTRPTMTVPCPTCGVQPGEPCTRNTGVYLSHPARVGAAVTARMIEADEHDDLEHESHGNCWCPARSHCTGGTDCDGHCELALRTLDRPRSEHERTCESPDCPVLTFVAIRDNHCPYCGRDAGDAR